MSRRWACYAAILAVLAYRTVSCPAEGTQDTARPLGPRRYSERISWHTTPGGLQLPEPGDSGDHAQDTGFLPSRTTPLDNAPGLTPPVSTPARTPGLQQKPPKSRNWVLPPPIEGQPPAKEEDEEPDRSGWGWLADDVRDRAQQKAEADERRKENEEEDEGTPAGAPDGQAKGKDEGEQKSKAGLLLDNTFEPVPTSDLIEEAGRRDIMDMVSTDESEAREKKALSQEAEAPLRSEALKPDLPSLADQQFGGDSRWGNEQMWSSDGSQSGARALPQTAALLSGIAKPAPARTAMALPSNIERPGARSGFLTAPAAPGADGPRGIDSSRLSVGTAPGAKSMFDAQDSLKSPQPVSSAFDPTPLLRRSETYRPLNAASPSAPLSSGSWPAGSR